jgi:hypothetical protein
MGKDGDSTEHTLRQYSENLRCSKETEIATSAAHNCNQSGNSCKEEREGKQSISKFNPRMERTLCLTFNREVGTRNALWPCWASHPRTGKANCAAGENESCLKEEE